MPVSTDVLALRLRGDRAARRPQGLLINTLAPRPLPPIQSRRLRSRPLSDAKTTNRRRHTIRPTGRKSLRGLHCGAVLLLAAISVLAAGCASVANPQGWAGPDIAEDTLYASIEKGKMAALNPDDLSVKWVFPSKDDEDQFDLEGIYGAPIVDGEVLYFGAYDDNVYALNAEDGTLRWAFKTNDPIVNALALRGEILYAGSTDGSLYELLSADSCANV
jgi:PQQ enzyme repeat